MQQAGSLCPGGGDTLWISAHSGKDQWEFHMRFRIRGGPRNF